MERVEAMQTIRGRGVLPDRAHGSEGSQERYLTHVEDVAGETKRVVKIVRPHGIQDMHAKGMISDRQMAKSDRFYEIYERAHSNGVTDAGG